MKSLADTSFFLLFDELLRRDRPKDGAAAWTAAGASWQHARHGYEGTSYGFATDIFQVACANGGWSLIVVKEHWWTGRQGKTIRSAHWAKPANGSHATILAWLKETQRELEASK